MKNKVTRNKYLIFIFIFILGLVVRLYKINTPLLDWHSFRQADTASVSKYFYDNGINLLDPRYHDISRVQSGLFNPNGYRLVEFPIYNALHAIFARIFSFIAFDTVGRLISVVFSLGTSIFIYMITSYYFGKSRGFLAMFIFLILPFNIYFSRVVLPEPLSVFLGLSALWFFIKYTNSSKFKDLTAYCLLMSLALLVKPYIVFYNVYVIYYFWKKYGLKKFFFEREYLFISALVFVPFMLWRVWISQHPEGIPFWKWTFNGDGVRFKPAFWYWIFGERMGKLILGVWGIYPFVIGILKCKRNSFIISLLLGGFLYMSVIATANVRHDYYQTLIIPVISITIAVGFWEILGNYKKNRNRFILPILIFLLMTLISAFQVKEYYKINHPEVIEAGKAVDRLVPIDALVIASYNGDTAFLYQTKRRGWPVVELPIDELIKEGASYYTSVNLNDSQTIEFMKRFQVFERTDTYVVLKLK